jgi:hypothetical protein
MSNCESPDFEQVPVHFQLRLLARGAQILEIVANSGSRKWVQPLPAEGGLITKFKRAMKKFALPIFLVLCVTVSQAQTKKSIRLDEFSRIAFRVPGKLYLKQGDTQKVEIEGDEDFLKELDIHVEGDRLTIEKEGSWRDWGWNWDDDDRVKVYVTMKQLEGLSVSGSGDLIAESVFKVNNLDLNVSGSGSLKLEAEASGDVDADVSGSGNIELSGKCRNFQSTVSGSGRVRMNETIAERAHFGVSGSGKIEASGKAQEVKTNISGSGKVLGANLETEVCDIRISGSGDVEINVNKALEAHISGSGSVSYRGNPAHVNSHASGSGHVRKM